jgi:archaellum component FlaC
MSEERLDKIDDAIQRLAVVASDLSKMLAVHEHRISHQEKTSENIVASMEKRRSEIDAVLKDVYDTIKSEVNTLRENSTKQHNEQNVKIDAIQKTIYKAMGAATVISFLAPYVLRKFM